MIDRLVRFINTISFHRGLSLGVLVGAAIAGSTLWSRLRVGSRTDGTAGADATTGTDATKGRT